MTSTAMQQLYQQIILDHAKARHGAPAEGLPPLEETGRVDPAAAGLRVTESHQVNTTCGDEVTVRLGLRAAGESAVDAVGDAVGDDVIEEFAWAGDGCSISMASASVLHDTVRGESVATARALLDTYREMLRSRGTVEPDEEVLGDAAAFAGVSRYPARVKCAMLAWVAFEAALPAGLRVTESHQVNTTCGDEVTVRIGLRGALRGVESAGEPAVGSAGEPAVGSAGEPADDAVIEELVWAGDGCSISMASASVLHDSVRGESVESSRALLNTFREMLRSRGTIEPDEEVLGDAAAFSGVSRYPARVKCAMLPWVAFEAALLTE